MSEERYEYFDNDEVVKLIKEKDRLIEAGRGLIKEGEVLEKKLAKANQKIQKIKDKVIKLAKPYVDKIELNEFELMTSMDLDGNRIRMTIVDQIESYKELLRTKQDGNKADSNAGKKSIKGTS